MEMTKILRGLFFYLKEKKAIGKIVLGVILIDLILPFKPIHFISWLLLIMLACAFVATLIPEEPSKSKEENKAVSSPVIDFKLNIMQTKLVNVTQSYITNLLADEMDEVAWEWYDEYSIQEYCEVLHNGGNVLIHLESEEYDEARITLYPTPKIDLINLTYDWFSGIGKQLISDYVYFANSQGVKVLTLNESLINGFPNENKWDVVSEYLITEGYKVKLLNEGIEITWPQKIVNKINDLGGAANAG